VPNQSEIPDACYDLLEAVCCGGKRVPWRELPEQLQDVGLVKVGRHHQLIELVLRFEPNHQTRVALPANCAVVGAPACWLPFHQMCRTSVEDAIAQDAVCEDSAKFLHVQMNPRGETVYEEWRLRGKPRNTATATGGHDELPAESRLDQLRPSQKKAHLQRCEAQKSCPSIQFGQAGDRAAYAWLVEHRDNGQDLCSIMTWLRYLRAARRILGEKNPRAGREDGPSIVHRDEI
jgi:hypothetical protein